MVIHASVVMNVGTPKNALMTPLAQPSRNPVARATTMAPATTRYTLAATPVESTPPPAPSAFSMMKAVRQPENATAEPTPRSISPAMITMVIPNAMIPCIETLRRMLSRFSVV